MNRSVKALQLGRRRIARGALRAFLCTGAMAGCHRNAVQHCFPEHGATVWIERHNPAGSRAQVDSLAALALKLLPDSSATATRGRQTVAAVTGPTGALRPDTLLARIDERTGQFPLPRANRLRPGVYTVRLFEITYATIAREVGLAPGEAVSIEAQLHPGAYCIGPVIGVTGR